MLDWLGFWWGTVASPPTALRPSELLAVYQPLKDPVKKASSIFPIIEDLGTVGVLVQDHQTNQVLYEKAAHQSRPIASISKLLTYAVIRQSHELDEVVTVDPRALETIGAKIGLYAYEKLTVQTLLEAMLITSANDAAVALAIFHAGEESAFAQQMQALAQEWGLFSAEIYNSTGLDLINESGEVVGNQLSAYDVAQLARRLWQDEYLRSVVQQPHFYGTSADEKFFHEKASTNKLLSAGSPFSGLKTGFTNLAGECLVAIATKNSSPVIIVVLGSQQRFSQVEKLFDWVRGNFRWL